MKKDNISMVCKVTHITETEVIKRNPKPPFTKRTVTLQTHDGQILFCEIRKLHLLKGIQVDDIVDVKISFSGSTKGEMRYNNIFINSITKR